MCICLGFLCGKDSLRAHENKPSSVKTNVLTVHLEGNFQIYSNSILTDFLCTIYPPSVSSQNYFQGDAKDPIEKWINIRPRD